MQRKSLLEEISQNLKLINTERPMLISIDGAQNSGKAQLAQELSEEIKSSLKLPVYVISLDAFVSAKDTGSDGTYLSRYNDSAIEESILKAVRNEFPQFRSLCYEDQGQKEVVQSWTKVEKNAIIIVEGEFAHRMRFFAYWDYSIFLKNSDRSSTFNQTFYIPYLNKEDPISRADLTIDMSRPEEPLIIHVYREEKSAPKVIQNQYK